MSFISFIHYLSYAVGKVIKVLKQDLFFVGLDGLFSKFNLFVHPQ